MQDTCKGCGCTNDRACPEGCYWVKTNWCSACHIKSIKPIADKAVTWMRAVSKRAPSQLHTGTIAGRTCEIVLEIPNGPRLQVNDHIGAIAFTMEPGRAYLAPQYEARELVTMFESLLREA